MKKYNIGVSGSAFFTKPEIEKLSYEVGFAIAKSDHTLLYGGGSGYPRKAAEGALAGKGKIIGISTALNLEEHEAFIKAKKLDGETLVFTGFGIQGRDVILVRSCDAVIFINGGEGSLLEFTVGYRNNKVLGLLEGSGGITDHLEEIMSWFYKKPGVHPTVVKDKDPKELVKKVLASLRDF